MKLWSLNKWFRKVGFVLVVETGSKDTILYFKSRKKYDAGCKS